MVLFVSALVPLVVLVNAWVLLVNALIFLVSVMVSLVSIGTIGKCIGS